MTVAPTGRAETPAPPPHRFVVTNTTDNVGWKGGGKGGEEDFDGNLIVFRTPSNGRLTRQFNGEITHFGRHRVQLSVKSAFYFHPKVKTTKKLNKYDNNKSQIKYLLKKKREWSKGR